MKNTAKYTTFAFSAMVALSMMLTPVQAKNETAAIKTIEYKTAAPLEIVAQPQSYLHKKVKMTATFNKFSTLGLDYTPAFKDSQKYISFLIKRDDSADHTIPLSEMKIIIQRDKAEKLMDLENGDKIEFSGEVFSTALNDPWIEVDNLKILTPKEKKVAQK